MLKERLSSIRIISFMLIIFVSMELLADDLTGVKIFWKAPTKYTNGEPLRYAEFELIEYRLYYGPSRKEVRSKYVTVNSKELFFPLQKLNLSKIESPIVYLAVTAVPKRGQESDLSEIIFFLP